MNKLVALIMFLLSGPPVLAGVPPLAPAPGALQDAQCVLTLGTQEMDFGRHSRWELEEVGHDKLSPGKRELLLSASCPYSQSMQLILRGSRNPDGSARWGDNGSVQIRLHDAELDGHPVSLQLQNSAGLASEQGSLLLKPDESFSATRSGTPLQGKFFTVQMEVIPLISARAARVTQKTASEAQLSFELQH